jgi:hypothetical protein
VQLILAFTWFKNVLQKIMGQRGACGISLTTSSMGKMYGQP